MRIPISYVIPLCLLTIGLIGWLGMKDRDFVKAPSAEVLEAVRAEALASLPTMRPEDMVLETSIAVEPQKAETHTELVTPSLALGEEKTEPILDAYSDRAADGAPNLLALAKALEEKNSPALALLANERVLDLASSSAEDIQSALISIARLRPLLPAWKNADSPIYHAIIHVGTGQFFSKQLPATLDSLVANLNEASSGIIQFSYKLNIGDNIQSTNAPTPIALWITGTGKDSPSTDVLSFTTDDSEKLSKELSRMVFQLTRTHLAKHSSHNPAPEAANDIHFALQFHLTRLLWSEFGSSLNPSPKQ